MSHPLLASSFHDITQFFVKGGIFMVPLVACSIVAVAVIILRGLALRRHLIIPAELQG